MTREQQTRLYYGLTIMFGIAIAIGAMTWKSYNGQLSAVTTIEVGLMLGFAISIAVAFFVSSRNKGDSPVNRKNAHQTAEILVIPKEDYVASVKLLGDRMASPDPAERALAAQAYDAFLSSVRPA